MDRVRRGRAPGEEMIDRDDIVKAKHARKQLRHDVISGWNAFDDRSFPVSAIEYVVDGQ